MLQHALRINAMESTVAAAGLSFMSAASLAPKGAPEKGGATR